MQRAIPCSLYRGGTSKGLFFHAADLPSDPRTRNAVLLAAMGSPDPRQIDGLGGADPLTSKVAVIGPPSRPDADIDYLFLQVYVNEALVSDTQNCGNILAAVGPFAIEEGLVPARGDQTSVRIHMVNTESLATATISTPGGRVDYAGDCRIDGVPGTSAAIPIAFLDMAGSSCGALLPTGRVVDRLEGIEVTCIDNGMPVVIVRAADLGVTGTEPPETLEADNRLKGLVEKLRLAAGLAMGMGDVGPMSTPKVTLVSPPIRGGAIHTRTFIPHQVHKTIGVFGAVSVATAACLPGSVASSVSAPQPDDETLDIDVEHAAGAFSLRMTIERRGGVVTVRESALLRTARRLMSGNIFVPATSWSPG